MVVASGRCKEVLQTTKKQWIRHALLGFLNPFLYYLMLFKAYDLLPAQQAQPINLTWVLVLAVLSVPLLGQRMKAGDFLGLLIGYFGVLFISTNGDILSMEFTSVTGVALALGSSVVWALYWIYNTGDKRHPIVCLFQNFLCAVPLMLTYSMIVFGFHMPEFKGIIGALYIGTFEMSIGFVLWLSALKLSENTAKVGSLVFFTPCISLIFIHYFVGERIETATGIGLIFIVTGVLVSKKPYATHKGRG